MPWRSSVVELDAAGRSGAGELGEAIGRDHSEQGGSDAEQEARPEDGGLVPDLALQPDNPAQRHCGQ
jgi:hypothetical protein